MSGQHNAMDLPTEAPARRDAKWSPRKAMLFVLGFCIICWGLLIGKAALFL